MSNPAARSVRRPDPRLAANLARNLRTLRTQARRTQPDVAQAAGVQLRMLQNYESGSSMPPADVALLLSQTLGTTVNALFADDGSEDS